MARNFHVILDEVNKRNKSRDARRLFHGRGHYFPEYTDLNVDQFGDYLLITAFDSHIGECQELAALLAECKPDIKGIALQIRRGRQVESLELLGSIPNRIVASEAGLKYWVELRRNQNIGLFLDMAPARRWLTQQINYYPAQAQPSVLNLFAFTCAFSVAALAAGASKVVNNDMAKAALQWGRENHELNQHDQRRVTMLGHNLFKSWRKVCAPGPYDIVIIDPPSNQRGSFNAEKQYSQILKRLPSMAKPGAWVMACLNSPFLTQDFLLGQVARWSHQCELVEHLPRSEDFPDASDDSGLKISLFRYRA